MFSDRNLLMIGTATNLIAGYVIYQSQSAGYEYQDCLNGALSPESCADLNDRYERMKIAAHAAIGMAAIGACCVFTWAARKLSNCRKPQFTMLYRARSS